ncbi:MAG: phosphotransferase [Alphaproteobacteria bacterium]|nr:phosphotransferase [Alphaproteobacteria bacterium]
MWIYFFAICDFLCRFIPVRRWRMYMRRVKLFDWYRKYNALKRTFPNLDFYDVKMIKGGWNIGFIVENQFVFKVRKHTDSKVPQDKIVREKRITDALSPFSPVRILSIRVIQAGEYMFYKYPFIPGKNLNSLSVKKIIANREKLAQQIASFIYRIHNSKPVGIDDLKNGDGDGWNHNDLCNNIIVDPKTMNITGIIDWEYAGWGTLETEFENTTAFSSTMRESGLNEAIRNEYATIIEKVAAKQQRQQERLQRAKEKAAALAKANAESDSQSES